MPTEIAPRSIQIDASSHCQLACPACPTATGAVRPTLAAGHLKIFEFQELLDKNPSITDVELSNYGEMFLNPQLRRILECAYERKVVLHADNGVNLNFADEEVLEGLVRYKFRSMTCSIDGASQQTYSAYRVRGDFDRVISHIRRVNEHKRRLHSGLPRLHWQFVIFGHNEHEIEAARERASELGMGFSTKLSWDDDFSPIRRPDLVRIQTRSPYATRDQFRKATGVDYMRNICHQLWRAPVLNWDGKVLGWLPEFLGRLWRQRVPRRIRAGRQQRKNELRPGDAPRERGAAPGYPLR